MTSQEIVLITGANTGLGFETARQLLKQYPDRFYILLGCRTLSKGEEAVKTLQDEGYRNCETLHIDVTSDESVSEAAKYVQGKFGRIDVLDVNAGIAPEKDLTPAGHSFSSVLTTTFQTNVSGAAATVESFTPLLLAAAHPRLVFISTSVGSLTLAAAGNPAIDTWPAYATSKAALNMLVLYYVRKFEGKVKVNMSSPGFRATQLNHFAKGVRPGVKVGSVEAGTRNAVRLICEGEDGASGTLTQMNDETGAVENIPW